MLSFLYKCVLYFYALVGVTITTVLALAVAYFYFNSVEKSLKETHERESIIDPDLKISEVEERQSTGVNALKKGWITVTGEYYHHAADVLDDTEDEEADKKTMKKAVRKRNRYYGVLRHANLFLYKDDTSEHSSLVNVVNLTQVTVAIWPRDLTDGQLFTKRAAIALLKNLPETNMPEILKTGVIPSAYKIIKNSQHFIYIENTSEMEDWYFELIKATKLNNSLSSLHANTMHFATKDMMELIQTMNSTEGQFQTKWLNGIMGRIFLALQQTNVFHKFLQEKVHKKLTKLQTPGFLDDIVIKHIDVGHGAPLLTSPTLERMDPNGTLVCAFVLNYTGEMSIQISTKANINLGYTSRVLPLELSVKVKKLIGKMLVKIKPPPSNRVWYCFADPPELDLEIEPIISTRSINAGVITKAIAGKFKDAIRDSLVHPYWDDLVFFKTDDMLFRGGIWDNPDPEVNVEMEDAKNEVSSTDLNEKFDVTPTTTNINSDVISVNTTESSDSFGKSEASSLKLRSKEKVDQFKKILNRNDTSASMMSSDTAVTTGSRREKAAAVLQEEAAVYKKNLQTGVKKLGKWYKTAATAASSVASSKLSSNDEPSSPNMDEPYHKLPEMISQRRARGVSTGSQDSANTPRRSAPVAHQFPQEFVQELVKEESDAETSKSTAVKAHEQAVAAAQAMVAASIKNKSVTVEPKSSLLPNQEAARPTTVLHKSTVNTQVISHEKERRVDSLPKMTSPGVQSGKPPLTVETTKTVETTTTENIQNVIKQTSPVTVRGLPIKDSDGVSRPVPPPPLPTRN